MNTSKLIRRTIRLNTQDDGLFVTRQHYTAAGIFTDFVPRIETAHRQTTIPYTFAFTTQIYWPSFSTLLGRYMRGDPDAQRIKKKKKAPLAVSAVSPWVLARDSGELCEQGPLYQKRSRFSLDLASLWQPYAPHSYLWGCLKQALTVQIALTSCGQRGLRLAAFMRTSCSSTRSFQLFTKCQILFRQTSICL